MSKGMDRKKDTKKKPAKTLMEKRAAKKQKKESRPFSIARSALVSAYRLTLKYSWGRCSESLRRGPSRSLDWLERVRSPLLQAVRHPRSPCL